MSSSTGDPQKKPRWTRRSAPRTRSGCCDGYPVEPERARRGTAVVKAQAALLPRPVIPRSILTSIFDNDLEKTYFDLWHLSAPPSAHAFLDSGDWTKLIRRSIHIPSIRYGVVAVGALGLAFAEAHSQRTISSGSIQHDITNAHHKIAVKYYDKAVKLMMEDIASGTQDLRTTLMTCLIMLCFESFHGNYPLAVAQIRTGTELISEWRSSLPDAPPSNYPSPDPTTVEHELVQAFGGLSIQTFSNPDPRPMDRRQALRQEGVELLRHMPSKFTSVKIARSYLELVLKSISVFLSVTGVKMWTESEPIFGSLKYPETKEKAAVPTFPYLPEDHDSPDQNQEHLAHGSVVQHLDPPLDPDLSMAWSSITGSASLKSATPAFLHPQSEHHRSVHQMADFVDPSVVPAMILDPSMEQDPVWAAREAMSRQAQPEIPGQMPPRLPFEQCGPEGQLDESINPGTFDDFMAIGWEARTIQQPDLQFKTTPIIPGLPSSDHRSEDQIAGCLAPGTIALPLDSSSTSPFTRSTDTSIPQIANENFISQNAQKESSLMYQIDEMKREENLAKLRQWDHAFRSMEGYRASKDESGMLLLRLHYKTAIFALSSISLDPMAYDKHHDLMYEIVTLSSRVLGEFQKLGVPFFTPDIGVILPLYLVGMKCRFPDIRARIVNLLLRESRREGIWDSILAGKIVEWVQSVEEKYMEGEGDKKVIPGWARVEPVNTSFDLQERRATVVCFQKTGPDDLLPRKKEATLLW
ncbi:uncharacterized protein PAC_16589 [Phialocephala subalpina]|uniref:Uncharacterized protein n=1 Tax=Phialocephala subalpina TaxID=576137 RepID=A0A1L7XNT2_9HELO|nr:uncharacterized protein PAC_16589 [Phialocephala subalpina]